jgi:hypothetical protein
MSTAPDPAAAMEVRGRSPVVYVEVVNESSTAELIRIPVHALF